MYKCVKSQLSIHCIDECNCPPYAECQRDENSTKGFKCVCPPSSSEDQSTVCGSDGRTYINTQVLQRESCLFEAQITVLYSGTCSEYWQYIPLSLIKKNYLFNHGQ